VAILTSLKVTQIAASGGQWSAFRRLWHLLGVVDTRDARRVAQQMDLHTIGIVLIDVMLAVGALVILGRMDGLAGISRTVIWVLATATFAYAVIEVFSGLVQVAYHAMGWNVPAVQCHPIRARSLAEFWGRRWNRVVSGWLREFVFLPFARRGRPRLGVAASFGASALIHSWLIIGLGTGAAAMMAAYFFIQGVGMLIESRMGLRRVPLIVARLWVAGMLLVPLPLLFGPWMEALDGPHFWAS
jgi:D-alanyl-lipoteichoic acid acyltransferase DltB (MBOAT superfamily)